MISSPDLCRIVYGVDFSGARDAGRKIWIAHGIIEEDVLLIRGCFRAKDLGNSTRDRDQSLKALREYISNQKGGVFGLDFPFGIPRCLVKEKSWEQFVFSFEDTYFAPEEFRAVCRLRTNGKELKRFTDSEARTPFSPYNLRLHRQTYFGIRDLLGPLIKDNRVCVLPMQKPLPDRPWVLEVCPASTLRRQHLSLPYKGRGEIRKTARVKILEGIEKTGVMKITEPSLPSKIFENKGGDALDSVIAAFAAFRALRNGFIFDGNCPYTVEGWVYV